MGKTKQRAFLTHALMCYNFVAYRTTNKKKKKKKKRSITLQIKARVLPPSSPKHPYG